MTDNINAIVALLGAIAGLLTAASVLLGVLVKASGSHSTKLDGVAADVATLAATATTAAVDAQAVTPALVAAEMPRAPVQAPPAPPTPLAPIG